MPFIVVFTWLEASTTCSQYTSKCHFSKEFYNCELQQSIDLTKKDEKSINQSDDTI